MTQITTRLEEFSASILSIKSDLEALKQPSVTTHLENLSIATSKNLSVAPPTEQPSATAPPEQRSISIPPLPLTAPPENPVNPPENPSITTPSENPSTTTPAKPSTTPPENPSITTPLENPSTTPPENPVDPLEKSSASLPPKQLSPNVSITGPVFHCNYRDIKKLNEVIFKQFSSDPIAKKQGYFKIKVYNLPPLAVDREFVPKPGLGHVTSLSSHKDRNGFISLLPSLGREIKLPDFPLPVPRREPQSREALKESWEATLRNPPQHMNYIIGEPLFSDVTLSSGQGLEQRGGSELPGIGTTYAYLGLGVTGSTMHGEDANLSSLNLVRSGAPKDWIIIEPGDKEKIEGHMREEFPKMTTCSQAPRHLRTFFPPSKLDAWGIQYSLVRIYPGQAIFTLPGALHQVKNDDTNYALATNVLLETQNLPLEGYRFCSKRLCQNHYDKRSITAAHLELRNRRQLFAVQANEVPRLLPSPLIVQQNTKRKVSTQQLTAPVSAQSQVRMKRKAAPDKTQPKKLKLTPQIQLLSDAVNGKEAFYRLSALVYGWRDQWKTPDFGKGSDSAVRLVQIISRAEATSQLAQVSSRIGKVRLAEIIDQDKTDQADPAAITNLISKLKWQPTKANRRKLHDYLKEGRQWKRIRGTFDGLLCLIPTGREGKEASCRTYYNLGRPEIQQFHSLLGSIEFTNALCQTGAILESSILNNIELPQFKWESEDPQTIHRLSIKELAPFMAKFRVIEKSECNVAKYDWPKPDCWGWEWPNSPDWIPAFCKQCDLCHDKGCDGDDEGRCSCIRSCLPKIQPRITNEPGKGQGVRAIDIAYTKDQILGELLGEFVPLNTFNDEWTMVLDREDLDEPIAQLWTKEMGNWVRKVNHACEPSAEFTQMKISGFWRVMLIATQDIPLGAEITAFCGADFLQSQGKLCHCDKCNT